MFGGKASVKLDPDLLRRARTAAETAGYADVEEFLRHVIEKELLRIEEAREGAPDEEELRRRLRGLGYIS